MYSPNKGAIDGTPTKEGDFALDALGNWSGYVKKTAGTTDLSQTRTHNLAKEVTEIDSSLTLVAEDAGRVDRLETNKNNNPSQGKLA